MASQFIQDVAPDTLLFITCDGTTQVVSAATLWVSALQAHNPNSALAHVKVTNTAGAPFYEADIDLNKSGDPANWNLLRQVGIKVVGDAGVTLQIMAYAA